MKFTHFHEPLKQIRLKGRRVPLHLLDSVRTELNRIKDEGHIKKLENCDKDRFISPIVITSKKRQIHQVSSGFKLYKYTNVQEKIPNAEYSRTGRQCRGTNCK